MPINTGLAPNHLEIWAVAVDSTTNPATIYAGDVASGGVLQSTNGSTWNASSAGIPPTVVIKALVVDTTTSPATVYAGGGDTSLSEARVFKSNNGGAHWTSVSSGLSPAVQVYGLTIDTTTSPATIYASTATGSNGAGVFKSTNGSSWTAINTGLPSLQVYGVAVDPTTAPATILASIGGTVGGIFRSTSSGNSWTATKVTNNVFAFAVDSSTHPATIYAGGEGMVFKSVNHGKTWKTLKTGMLSSIFVEGLTIDPTTSPAAVYAGAVDGIVSSLTNNAGAFVSTKRGTKWSHINPGLTYPEIHALAVDPTTSPATVYAATDGGGMFRMGPPCTNGFVDNGDGTVTDGCTGLMWEKKDQAGGLHDVNTPYDWAGECDGAPNFGNANAVLCQPTAAAAAACAGATGGAQGCAQCGAGQGVCRLSVGTTTVWGWLAQLNSSNFAGHSDWRIPSEDGLNPPGTGPKELQSILSLPVPQAFEDNCAPGCSVMTCSCTATIEGASYWSATSDPGLACAMADVCAWVIDAGGGSGGSFKDNVGRNFFVRAVRP